jgi:hypothetical protein
MGGKLKATQPQIPIAADDAVRGMLSRGHDGREDGSLTLGIASCSAISFKQLQEVQLFTSARV